MPAWPAPKRHWRSNGNDPTSKLSTSRCARSHRGSCVFDRRGKERMIAETHMAQGEMRMVFDGSVTSASNTQARRVFYAGAQSILDILAAGLGPENKLAGGDVDRMEALSAELRRFGEDVEEGRA
jgi:hypothetical protein